MTNETNVKICYECNIEKPLNKFHYKYQKSKLKYIWLLLVFMILGVMWQKYK